MIENSTVMVCGLGGLAGWIALLCARLGVARIVGIDADTVQLSDLHREGLYGAKHVGLPKAEVAAQTLTQANPALEFNGHRLAVEKPDDVGSLMDGVDLVINPFPYVPPLDRGARAFALAAVRAGVPALNMPMTHGVGPLTIPGETACIDCAWAPLRAAHGVDAEGAVAPAGWTERGFLAALAPRQAISGGLAGGEAAIFLSGGRPRTLDGVAFLDIDGYTRHGFLQTTRDPDCEVCGAGSRDRQVLT